MLNWVALFASIASGSTLPLMTIIFGRSTAQFNNFAVVGPSPSGFDDKLHGYVYAKTIGTLITANTIAGCALFTFSWPNLC